MSIWGKIIGGAAGFALGGPLGAIVGAAAGHAVDKMRAGPPSEKQRQAAFSIAVIVLAAKMAKADGVVTRDEIDTFKRMFHVPAHEMRNVGRLFDQAKQDSAGYAPYARQVAELFHDSPLVLEELLDGLFLIAKADNVVHPAELQFLYHVSEIFGFDQATFERICESQRAPVEADPYGVLGVGQEESDADIRDAYRALVREHHPDRLMAQGMPQEFIDVANKKVAAINEAYHRIRRERNMK
ncbi:MAG: TerB family tellurite resistance protein [Proteobacteria bacterium]|nr:TerB family tellurite resistance protein [Pseudomonadota bacterium]